MRQARGMQMEMVNARMVLTPKSAQSKTRSSVNAALPNSWFRCAYAIPVHSEKSQNALVRPHLMTVA